MRKTPKSASAFSVQQEFSESLQERSNFAALTELVGSSHCFEALPLRTDSSRPSKVLSSPVC